MTAFLSRRERFASVGSTNDVVREWLAVGTAEVCLAVADEQAAGRGRNGRSWTAPAGSALLLSLGFRPDWLPPDRVWRLVATAGLAMAEAAETVAGIPDGTIRLKWPNDLVVETRTGGARKLAGLLGETDGLGTDDPRATVGLGINADWAPADFPPELADSMTSLREAAGGRPIDRDALLDAFLARLEGQVGSLRSGSFDAAEWADRQVTTGRDITLAEHDGLVTATRAVGVDGDTGGLLVADATAPGATRQIVVGEVVHVRLATSTAAAATPSVTSGV